MKNKVYLVDFEEKKVIEAFLLEKVPTVYFNEENHPDIEAFFILRDDGGKVWTLNCDKWENYIYKNKKDAYKLLKEIFITEKMESMEYFDNHIELCNILGDLKSD